MIRDIKYYEWAVENGYDVSYNQGSQYYNIRSTRIAYYVWLASNMKE